VKEEKKALEAVENNSQTLKEDPFYYITPPSCNKCKLCETSSARGIVETCIPGCGPIVKEGYLYDPTMRPIEIMLVGEAPGYDEVLQRKPFVGEAGKVLDKCLTEAGVERRSIFITNVVKCRPLNNETPPLSAIKACAEYLDKEIEEIKPRVIGLLGNVAIERVLGKGVGGVSKIRGNVFWSEKYNCTCIPMFHPAYLLRNIEQVSLVDYLVKDLRLLKEAALVEKYEKKVKPVTYTVCDTIEKVKELFANLMKEPVFCFDLETTGFDFLEDDILCTSFSYQEYTAFVLPLFLKDNYWKENEKFIIESLKKCFARTDCEKVAHNLKFDAKFLRRIGVEVKGSIFDTMIAHYLLDENARGEHGLKDLAWKYTDIGGYDKEIKSFIKDGLDKAPRELLYKYSATDPDCTMRLYNIFKPKLEKEKVSYFYATFIIPAIKLLIDMEWVGVKVDSGRLKFLGKKYSEILTDIESRLRNFPEVQQLEQRTGKAFNFRSPLQLRELLFGYLKLPSTTTTAKGFDSTGEKVLEEISKLHEIPKLLLDHRKYSKLKFTYVEGIKDLIAKDGRLHTTYLLHGTTTGRLASAKPNLQNIPRDGEIKSIFVPGEGWIFIEADYSQIEFRAWANYSKDTAMIEDIKSGKDIHRMIASIVFGCSSEQITRSQRQVAKGTVYGLMYGRGSDSIAKEFGISVLEAKKIVDVFFSRYPQAKEFLENIKKQVRRDGRLRSFFGRIRRLPGIHSRDKMVVAEAERQALNFPFQSMASDITMLCGIRVQEVIKEKGFKSYQVLTVHDSLVWEVPKEELEEMLKIVYEETSRQLPGITVPIEAEIKVTNVYGGEK